ncbi:shikimate kinase [Jaminaea rosea]|uniref:Gluconokinase n=1 Tax=Jaminaea rosea TaxID=1569628 RepID=A0A316UVP9_9BASI|nr:shikimate kinase [Jaminaea rosea]PWN27205.1 shikimate kinase [Jaminaea rosea]
MISDAAPATLIIVMGTSGSGKSTLGASLSSALGIPFIDGDDLHPPANVAKMASGHPLNDNDREPWLKRIRETAIETLLGDGASPSQHRPPAMIIACSSLKRSYRDLLRGSHSTLSPTSPPLPASGLRTLHLYVDVSPTELLRRMHERKGHFMKEEMLKSQLETLEKPVEGSEEGVIVVQDGGREEVESRAAMRLRKELGLVKS